MEDLTANPDNLDGDFKALQVMRRNRLTRISEREERERQLIEKSIHKFIDNKNKKAALKRRPEQKVTVVEEERIEKVIDYDLVRATAFKSVDDNDAEMLRSKIQEVVNCNEDLDVLRQLNTDETLLHRALNRPTINMEIVQYLIQTFSEGHICTCQQLTVGGKKSKLSTLHIATEHGHVEAAKLIVSSITNDKLRTKLLYMTTVIVPEGQRPRPLSCLHIAAKCGINELVSYFVKNCEMPVNLANDKGDLPILWAANDNKPMTVQLLIALGADVNGQNDKGSSALHWACRNGHTEVVRVLLSESKDVNVNIKRRLGLVCPIIAASAMGFTEIVKLLIDYKAEIDIRMKSLHTALHFAAVEGHLDIVMQLIDAGAALDSIDDKGNDALLLAASHGQHLVVMFLAKCGSSFHHRNNAGKSVWEFALEQKNAKLMMALVDHVSSAAQSEENDNVPPDQSRSNSPVSPISKLVLPPGITPLHAAASIGDTEIIQFLIDMNLDTSSTDNDESTFIHVAAKHNQCETLKRFATESLCRNQDIRGYTPLQVACELACNEAIAILLPMSNLSQMNKHKQTALHVAARTINVSHKNTKALITQMISHHDWTVLHLTDSHQRSALHSAVLAGNAAIISELDHLSPNALDSNGSAPMHTAIINGDHDMLDQLIKVFSSVVGRAIDVNKWDESGETPLHLAAKHCQARMTETLIRSGADLLLPNSNGRTVLHELAYLITNNRSEELNYMQVFDVIQDTCLQWWCRLHRKTVPSQQADDNVEYRKHALLHLFTNVYEKDGYNVLQYAAKFAVKEMVIAILNTPHVFRVDSLQANKGVRYDVSDLLPFTSTHDNRRAQQRRSKVSAVKPSEDKEGQPSVERIVEPSASSIADLLVKVDSHAEVAAILKTSPFKNIVDSYWGAYQKLYAASFVFHVLIMSVYSYSGTLALNCLPDSALNESAQNSTAKSEVYVRTWQLELGLAFSVMWPICLLIYDGVKVVKFLIALRNTGFSQTLKSLTSQGDYLIGFLILQLCGFMYSVLTIAWYVMNHYCISSQDYVLAISYIMGWVYSITFTRGFKQIHHFSTILQHILFRDMLRFGFIYLFILLAFSFAYGALVQAIPSLRISGGRSIFLVFNWMIGMEDFSATEEDFENANKSVFVVQIVYSSYIILSTIVLLNLLIAMMSDSYADVRTMSEVMWKVGSLRLPLEFEEGLGRSYYRPQQLHFDADLERWFIDIPKKDIVEKEPSSDTVIHDLTMRVEKLVEESRVRESRVLALLEAKGDEASES